MNRNDSKGHVNALDGLRGAAVLMVMLYHFAHVPSISHSTIDSIFYRASMTGWIGVDLFFSLSGFLITGILLRAKKSPNYLITFYGRRALRIFPLYYLYIGALFAFVFPHIVDKVDGGEHAKVLAAMSSWPWFLLYLSNIKQAMTGVFFGAGAGHLWSLAIEEQFYLIWPLVVLFCSEFILTATCCVLLVLAVTLRLYLASHLVSPEIIYVFTPARMDGLLCGALAAIISKKCSNIRKYSSTRVPAVCLLVFFIFLIFIGPRAEGSSFTYTWGFSALAIIFGSLTYAVSRTKKSVFNMKAMVALGKYSYALYIFHPIVRIVVLKAFGSPKVLWGSQIPWQIAFSGTCLVISFGIALISWKFFEKHFIALKDTLFPQIRIPSTGLSMAHDAKANIPNATSIK